MFSALFAPGCVVAECMRSPHYPSLLNCAHAADGIMRPILYLWIFPLLICLGIYDCEHISTHPQISCDPYLSVIGQLQHWRSLIGQTSCDPLSGDCCFSLLHLAPGVQITAKNIQINTIFDSWCAKWKLFLISLYFVLDWNRFYVSCHDRSPGILIGGMNDECFFWLVKWLHSDFGCRAGRGGGSR